MLPTKVDPISAVNVVLQDQLLLLDFVQIVDSPSDLLLNSQLYFIHMKQDFIFSHHVSFSACFTSSTLFCFLSRTFCMTLSPVCAIPVPICFNFSVPSLFAFAIRASVTAF